MASKRLYHVEFQLKGIDGPVFKYVYAVSPCHALQIVLRWIDDTWHNINLFVIDSHVITEIDQFLK